jgi:hypothetical protein
MEDNHDLHWPPLLQVSPEWIKRYINFIIIIIIIIIIIVHELQKWKIVYPTPHIIHVCIHIALYCSMTKYPATANIINFIDGRV